jgi:hypothetical protein
MLGIVVLGRVPGTVAFHRTRFDAAICAAPPGRVMPAIVRAGSAVLSTAVVEGAYLHRLARPRRSLLVSLRLSRPGARGRFPFRPACEMHDRPPRSLPGHRSADDGRLVRGYLDVA